MARTRRAARIAALTLPVILAVIAPPAAWAQTTTAPVPAAVQKPPVANVQPPALQPGKTFTIQFPEMPTTLAEVMDAKGIKSMMTVFLPQNYIPARKYPLLIFFNGGNGGSRGNSLGIARALTEETDFICADLPLFRVPSFDKTKPVIQDEDGKYMWPFHKQMLAELERVVPNVDTAHIVIGGTSNGAHAAQAIIDQSNGEAARMFAAVFFVNGGGRMVQYNLLKGKPLLIVYGETALRPSRLQEIITAAKAGGVELTTYGMKGVGHGFPALAYPTVRVWLRGPAVGLPQPQ
jgi:predicted esterase